MHINLIIFSIFTQVNITNPTRWLVKIDVISEYANNSEATGEYNKRIIAKLRKRIIRKRIIAKLQVNITKQKFSKWRLPVLWKFTDKEISEIKINSVSKNTKACVKILKQLFASGSGIIGDYSPRLRLGKYSPTITSPSANNC
jgi:hypothetical protein